MAIFFSRARRIGAVVTDDKDPVTLQLGERRSPAATTTTGSTLNVQLPPSLSVVVCKACFRSSGAPSAWTLQRLRNECLLVPNVVLGLSSLFNNLNDSNRKTPSSSYSEMRCTCGCKLVSELSYTRLLATLLDVPYGPATYGLKAPISSYNLHVICLAVVETLRFLSGGSTRTQCTWLRSLIGANFSLHCSTGHITLGKLRQPTRAIVNGGPNLHAYRT